MKVLSLYPLMMEFKKIILSIDRELNFMLESGAYEYQHVSREEVIKQYSDKKLSALLEYHKNKITEVQTGRFQGKITTYIGHGKERKKIYADAMEGMYKKLFDFYCGTDFKYGYTEVNSFEALYHKWQEQRKKDCVKDNTRLRNEQVYRKFLADTDFFKLSIKEVDRLKLQTFCNQLINRNSMTSPQWREVKTILRGIYFYALDIGCVTSNLMESVRIHAKFQPPAKGKKDKQTVSKETMKIYFEWLEDRFKASGDVSCLGIKLLFYTGLRSGELVALRWRDIEQNFSSLRIHSEEIKNQLAHKIEVAEHTKGYQERNVPLCNEAVRLLKRVYEVTKECEYIFTFRGKRVNYWHLERINRAFYEETGLENRSLHKIRKTFSSNMFENGAPITDVSDILGHRDSQVTLNHYIFSTNSNKNSTLKKFMKYR